MENIIDFIIRTKIVMRDIYGDIVRIEEIKDYDNKKIYIIQYGLKSENKKNHYEVQVWLAYIDFPNKYTTKQEVYKALKEQELLNFENIELRELMFINRLTFEE